MLRIVEDLPGRAVFDDAPLVEHGDAVGEPGQ
jgi:hypothetical protein